MRRLFPYFLGGLALILVHQPLFYPRLMGWFTLLPLTLVRRDFAILVLSAFSAFYDEPLGSLSLPFFTLKALHILVAFHWLAVGVLTLYKRSFSLEKYLSPWKIISSLLLFLFITALSSFLQENLFAHFKIGFQLLFASAWMILLSTHLIQDKKDLNLCILTLISCAFIKSLVGFLPEMGLFTKELAQFGHPSTSSEIFMGAYLGMALPLMASKILFAREKKQERVWIVIFCITFGKLLLTLARGPLVAVLVAISFALYLFYQEMQTFRSQKRYEEALFCFEKLKNLILAMIIPVILLILFSLDIPDILVHRLVALVSGFSDIIAFANLKVLGIVSSCLLTLFFLLPKKIPIGFHTIRKIPFLSGLCLFLLCLGLLLGKITIFVPSPGQLERYMGLSSVSNTYGSRGFYTINALREWRSAPLIGNGLGAVVFGSSHNLYIDFLAKTGILGVFSLLLFGFNLSRGTWLVLRSQFWMQDHALGILLCLLYYAIYSFSQTHYLQFYIWTIFGLALSLQRLIYKEFSPESREKASARMEDASRSRPSSIAGNALSIT